MPVGKQNGPSWHLQQKEKYAYSVIERDIAIDPSENGLNPFRLIWGESDRMHTLVCQGGSSRQMAYKLMENGIDLLFIFADPLQTDDKEKSREITFYFDMHEGINITQPQEIPQQHFY